MSCRRLVDRDRRAGRLWLPSGVAGVRQPRMPASVMWSSSSPMSQPFHLQLDRHHCAAGFLAARFSQSRPPSQGRASRVAARSAFADPGLGIRSAGTGSYEEDGRGLASRACLRSARTGLTQLPPPHDDHEIIALVSSGSWTIRLAAPGDAGFLTDMLVEAVNWPSARNHSEERILATPESAHYVTGWPRHDDLGVIAEVRGQPVGAAWLRFFTSNDPGYGFVSSDVPEIVDRRRPVLARARSRPDVAAGSRRACTISGHPENQPQRRPSELRPPALPRRGLPDRG